jgi:hypothetical protein
MTQPHVRFPTDVLDDGGLCCESPGQRCRLPCAGEREAQAPSTRTRRAWLLPTWGIAPCRRCAPEKSAEGGKPRNCLSALGVANRGRSPIAALRGTATGHGTPRKACSASPTGYKRQACPCSWRSCSSRWRRAVCSCTAWTYACKTMCCVGAGQTTSESHRRWAGPPLAQPV